MGREIYREVTVDLGVLKDYGYKGNSKNFIAVKQREDGYSSVYNLIDTNDEIIYDVLEEDLKILR